jgi:Transcriptional regulators
VLYEDRMTHEFFSSLMDTLRREAEARGYDLTLIGRDYAGATCNYYEHARRRNLDGVIVIQADFDSADVIRLATSKTPAVIIDHLYEGCDCICSDNRNSIERLVRYAYGLGHRKIAFIAGQSCAVTRERLAGYYKVCAELGIQVPDGYIREGRFHDPSECFRLIRELLAREDRPTCILCPDDYSCLGALWELKAAGIRIPEDVSLIGYDGISLADMIHPFLTTFRQSTERTSREAVSLLLDAVENPETHQPRQIIVEGDLVTGETVRELSR